MATKVERVTVLGKPFGPLRSEMTEPHALIERRGAVLIVTMNRPEVRNALSGPMMTLMVRHEALCDRTGVKGPRRLAVAAVR